MKRYLLLFCLGLLLAIPLIFYKGNDPRDVPFLASPPEVVDKMLEMAGIQPGDIIYDLGCGDGRIPIAAAKKYGVKAFGYDIDPERVRESLENVAKSGVESLVTIKEADMFQLDLSGADVVMLYIGKDLNVKLLPQLEKLKPGSRIVSHNYDLPGYRPSQTVDMKSAGGREHRIHVWVTPLARAD